LGKKMETHVHHHLTSPLALALSRSLPRLSTKKIYEFCIFFNLTVKPIDKAH
jgi:hypothetical protein